MIQPSNRLLLFHDLIDGRRDQHRTVIINNDDVVR
jgi:hypothetical protein